MTPPTMLFVGVQTGGSSSLRLFPAWLRALGIESGALVGVDLPIGAPADAYRAVVARIRDEPGVLGALVTTHKIDLYRAAHDLFDDFTDDAALCGEVSAIYKRGGRLIGHVVDPVTCRQALAAFIPADHWRARRADVLCLGAGGAATALVIALAVHAPPGDRPHRMLLVDRAPDRLDKLRALTQRLPDTGIEFAFIHSADSAANDRLLADLPPGSLVINATGMGKDLPGSPLTDAAQFPFQGFIWDLNYRGERLFLRQAEANRESRRLHIEDGWLYFLYGWAAVMGCVFDVPITPENFAKFNQYSNEQ